MLFWQPCCFAVQYALCACQTTGSAGIESKHMSAHSRMGGLSPWRGYSSARPSVAVARFARFALRRLKGSNDERRTTAADIVVIDASVLFRATGARHSLRFCFLLAAAVSCAVTHPEKESRSRHMTDTAMRIHGHTMVDSSILLRLSARESDGRTFVVKRPS